MSYLFVSYSRTQLPLAESLVLSAVEHGVPVWFDLLVLTPGRDWQADIDAGLDGAGAVALLGSAEALQSKAVAEEVTRALSRDKPLYLLMLDAVELRLAHAPDVSAQACRGMSGRPDGPARGHGRGCRRRAMGGRARRVPRRRADSVGDGREHGLGAVNDSLPGSRPSSRRFERRRRHSWTNGRTSTA